MDDQTRNTQESYDRVAAEYSQRIGDELDHKPLERQLLDRFAAGVTGRVCDLGCGPGHIAAYLHERGADLFGVDLSPGMVEQARLRYPVIPFEQGDMRALTVDDGALGGIVALYSIIHIPRQEVAAVLGELRRVLQPGGSLLIGFHQGEDVLRVEELWGKQVNLDFTFFTPAEMVNYLETARFEVEEVVEREPYAPEVEYQSQRAYIFARKPK
jgi:SAM-dependent methyltransferase